MNEENPYTLPVVLLLLGVVVGALAFVAGDQLDPLIAGALTGVASVLSFIGASAVAVLLGTQPLRDR